MSVGTDAVEQLLRRAVSAGAAVVVVILGPGQGAAPPAGSPPASGQVTTATVTPTATPTPDPALLPAPTAAPGRTVEPTTGTGRATAQPRRTTTATTSGVTPTPGPTSTRRTRASGRTRATAPTSGTAATGSATTDSPTRDSADAGDTGTATEGTTAAATRGWGAPTRAEDFDSGTDGWRLYDGPANNGEGRRAPAAVAVHDGLATISGDASGTTGGMCWGAGRRYGRWEARVRAPTADPAYHAVLLLWPENDAWPAGGEIDVMELLDPARHTAQGFVHHGADNRVAQGTVATDATRWHDWAVDWSPSSITLYLDGRPWYRTIDATVQPPGPMHLCVQLDWFPKGGAVRPSTMQVDWVREYDPDGAGPRGKPGGATGTGATRAEAG